MFIGDPFLSSPLPRSFAGLLSPFLFSSHRDNRDLSSLVELQSTGPLSPRNTSAYHRFTATWSALTIFFLIVACPVSHFVGTGFLSIGFLPLIGELFLQWHSCPQRKHVVFFRKIFLPYGLFELCHHDWSFCDHSCMLFSLEHLLAYLHQVLQLGRYPRFQSGNTLEQCLVVLHGLQSPCVDQALEVFHRHLVQLGRLAHFFD